EPQVAESLGDVVAAMFDDRALDRFACRVLATEQAISEAREQSAVGVVHVRLNLSRVSRALCARQAREPLKSATTRRSISRRRRSISAGLTLRSTFADGSGRRCEHRREQYRVPERSSPGIG